MVKPNDRQLTSMLSGMCKLIFFIGACSNNVVMVGNVTAIRPQPYLQEGEIHISTEPKYFGTKLFLRRE